MSFTFRPTKSQSNHTYIEGKVFIGNACDLNERLELIEKMLCIPTRNVKLEEKYEDLKTLADLYKKTIELETELEQAKDIAKKYQYELEKYRAWDALASNNYE